MSDQTIFRAHRTERDRFTSLLNETIRDKRMSFRATGLLVFLLSLPPDWKANQQHIVSCKTEGRDAVVTAWNELRDLGYINKEIVREKGKIVATVWHIYETPQGVDRPTDKPETVFPETVEPESENPLLQSTDGNEEQNERKVADAPVHEPSIQSKVDLPTELDNDDFVSAWGDWVEFRAERRIKPYQPRGAKAQLAMLAVMGSERAIAAIKFSIAQQYQGIYEQKTTTNGTSKPLAASHSNAGTSNASAASQY